jgi:WD40 repeat protein
VPDYIALKPPFNTNTPFLKSGKPTMRLIIFAFLLVLFAPPNQNALPPLEPITAANADRIEMVSNLGWGMGLIPEWAPDEEKFYYFTTTGAWEYHLADLANPIFVSDLPIPDYNEYEIAVPPDIPVAISSDKRYVVYQQTLPEYWRKSVLRVIDMQQKMEIKQIAADAMVPRSISATLFRPQFSDNKLLFLRKAALYRWNPVTDTEEMLIPSTNLDFAFSPTGHYAVNYEQPYFESSPMILKVWDLSLTPATLLYETEFPGVDFWSSIAFSPDGQQIATGGTSQNIRQWNIISGGKHFTEDVPPGGEAPMIDIAYSEDGHFMVGCVEPSIGLSYAFLFDASTGQPLATIDSYDESGFTGFTSVAFHPTQNTIAIGDEDGKIHLWDIDTLLQSGNISSLDTHQFSQKHTDMITALTFSKDGTKLAAASWDGTISITTYLTGETQYLSPIVATKLLSVAFHPDGNRLAASGENGLVYLWDLDTGAKAVWETDSSATDITFSPYGSILAAATNSGEVYILDIANLTQIFEFKVANDRIRDIDFNHNGTLLATANRDTTVKLWGIPKP